MSAPIGPRDTSWRSALMASLGMSGPSIKWIDPPQPVEAASGDTVTLHSSDGTASAPQTAPSPSPSGQTAVSPATPTASASVSSSAPAAANQSQDAPSPPAANQTPDAATAAANQTPDAPSPASAAGAQSQDAASPSARSVAVEAAPRLAKAPPVIAILVDGPPSSSSFRRDRGPVYITGGRTSSYAEAVEESGGQVRWLYDDGRSAEAQLAGVDGLLVPGGRDINPEVYGQSRRSSLNVAPMKFDLWEISVMQAALDKKMPVRGICRGMQLLNVAGKGTLMQDIADHLERPSNYRLHHTSTSHPIAIVPSTGFGKAMRDEALIVNSSHHQAIDRLAAGYQPVAVASDGIIEAIEKVDDPTVMGVQFHPERLQPAMRQRFFEAFVSDARARQMVRGDSEGPTPQEAVFVAPAPSQTAEAEGEKAAAPITLADIAYARSRATTAALEKLERQQMGLYTAGGARLQWDNLTMATRSDKRQSLQLRADGASEPQMEIASDRVEDFLLSMTEEGRRHLDEKVMRALDLIAEARSLSGPNATTADLFHRRSGWFHSKPVSMDIEAVWAMQDGKLQLRYHDPQMKMERRLDIDTLKSFSYCMQQMRDARRPS